MAQNHEDLFKAMIRETLHEKGVMDAGVSEVICNRAINMIIGMTQEQGLIDAWAGQILANRQCTPEEAYHLAESLMAERINRNCTDTRVLS